MNNEPDYTKDESVVFEREREYLEKRRVCHGLEPLTQASRLPLSGLCLSGGGIRSATFALGAMQAFARGDLLKHFDYLSTVSGGGYIGSALTWALHKDWHATAYSGRRFGDFGLDAKDFPFGTRRQRKVSLESQVPFDGSEPERSKLVRHISQHGNYLAPGDGIGAMSLLAVILRSSFVSFLVYFSLLAIAFAFLECAGTFSDIAIPARFVATTSGILACCELPAPANTGLNWFLASAVFLIGLFLFLSILYSLSTFFYSSRFVQHGKGTLTYLRRRRFERWVRRLLLTTLFVTVIGAIPHISGFLKGFYVLSGGASALGGLLASILTFFNSGALKKTRLSPSTLAKLGSVLLLTGILLLAYQTGAWLCDCGFTFLNLAGLLVLISFPLGYLSDLNAMSIHRYYRDRLMETFLPDIQTVLSGGEKPVMEAHEANDRQLHEMCSADRPIGPYHLINTNLILVDAASPEIRGRGGDNFLLSPRYCGSRATGWRATKEFLSGGLTLSTAMAISGAAVNPNTGSAGEGGARDKVLVALMGILGIGLGYWVNNPNPARKFPFWPVPNYLYPGIRALLPLGRFRENASRLQLSDGGHFENLGLYELIRREVKLIVVCDGGADPKFTFSDLANVIERVRNDFGAKIEIKSEDLTPMIPIASSDYGSDTPVRISDKPYVVAKIRYASDGPKAEPSGRLIYLNTVFTKGLPADLLGYRLTHSEFPDQPTLDQFFDERQFEAYRELGYQLTARLIRDFTSKPDEPFQGEDSGAWWITDDQLGKFFGRKEAATQ